MNIFAQDTLPGLTGRRVSTPVQADVVLLKSVEHDSRTWDGLCANNPLWAQVPARAAVVVYEHGLLSASAFCHRLLANQSAPDNLRAVLVWGEYSRTRLVEAGFPADRVFVVGPLFMPRILRRDPAREIAFLPCHDPCANNGDALKMLLKARAEALDFACYAKIARGAQTMRDLPNTTDTNRLGRAALCASALPFQTIAAATLAAGIPTLCCRPMLPPRWPREAAYARAFYGPLYEYALPWFDDAPSLVSSALLAEQGFEWPGVAAFLRDVAGVGIDSAAAVVRALASGVLER